jgi:hypothetical protein
LREENIKITLSKKKMKNVDEDEIGEDHDDDNGTSVPKLSSLLLMSLILQFVINKTEESLSLEKRSLNVANFSNY